MPAATSPLTWDAPLDGGSPLNGYRVLVFEGSSLVATLEPDTPSCVVEHSATVKRQALVQAWNDQGYGPGVQIEIPIKAETGTDPGTGGGGTTPDPGTGGGTTPGGGGTDGLTLTRVGDTLRFDITDSRASTLRYKSYTLYARTPADVSSGAYGTEVATYSANLFPLTPSSDDYTKPGSGYTSWGAYGLHTDQPRDVIFYADAPADSASSAPFFAPTLVASRSGSTITVEASKAGGGFTDSILYRDGQVWNQPAQLPFTETSNDAHTYFVRVTNSSGSLDSNTVSVAAYTAPPSNSLRTGDDTFNITRTAADSIELTFNGNPPVTGTIQLFVADSGSTRLFFADQITLPFVSNSYAQYTSPSAKAQWSRWLLRVTDGPGQGANVLWESQLVDTP